MQAGFQATDLAFSAITDFAYRGKEIINGREKSYPHCYLIQLNQIKLSNPYFPSVFGFTVTNATHEIADRQQGNPERELRIQTSPLPNYIPVSATYPDIHALPGGRSLHGHMIRLPHLNTDLRRGQFLILHVRGKKSTTEGQEKSYPDAHLSPLW
ncbi:hypothetical protein Cgig2_015594 [Carnegiea gigantea]|uniref:Uncharacterized protein n=1 Tax=Carnegiea gigantea TaxID=171969 RepID=A0A9Q1JXN7_9CARY|nr:hypothetical protein Cgig2_015594 [Carnegiea gigantea]